MILRIIAKIGKKIAAFFLKHIKKILWFEILILFLEKFKSELKIKEGESTPDHLFHLQCVRCVGCCGLAPVCVVNGKTYGRMTPEQVPAILDEWREVFKEA